MRGIEEIPPRTPVTLEPRKPPKSSPLVHGFGRVIKWKRTMKASSIHLPQNPKEKGFEIFSKKIAKKGLRKSPKRTNGKDTSKP
jgi:hypothetical protein